MTIDPTDRQRLHCLMQETRLMLVQNILGHHVMMPAMGELEEYNPDYQQVALHQHLDKLTDHGVVQRVKLPSDYRNRNFPYVFYTLTDDGYRLLDDHNILLPHLEEIRDRHGRVETTDTLDTLATAPRPTVEVSYDHPLRADRHDDPAVYPELG